MKEINKIEDSEWVNEMMHYKKNKSISNCIECCFSRRFMKKTPNCTSVKVKLHIPMFQCGDGLGHYERSRK